MTAKLFYDDPYAREFDAQLLSQSEHDGKFHIILDRTLFYPGGGGQPCDTGTIDGAEVIEVIEHGDDIIHITDSPAEGKTVHGVLNWERRFEHMQQHLGEHLFAGCLWNLHHIHTARMRIEGDNVSIDTDIPADMSAILEAESAANEAVWADIPAEVIFPAMSEIRELARKLPPENAVPPVRIIKVEGVDYVPCCGVHASSTGQVGLVKVISCENHKGGSRIYLRCGRAAYRWITSLYHEVRKAESELVCGYDGINDKIASLKSQIHALKSQNESLTVQYLKPIAESLLKDAEICGQCRIISHIMPHSSQDETKHLFKLITDSDKEAIAILAGVNGEGVFVMAGCNKDNRNIDVRPAFRKAIEILGGKGGGSPFSAQGWGKNSEAVNIAVNEAVNILKNNIK
ncbi:MAG: hypothetical protein IKQ95_07590 [Synergistaceae bacterium]|nr:hypothetical protein [Synergistaceae bacterium]